MFGGPVLANPERPHQDPVDDEDSRDEDRHERHELRKDVEVHLSDDGVLVVSGEVDPVTRPHDASDEEQGHRLPHLLVRDAGEGRRGGQHERVIRLAQHEVRRPPEPGGRRHQGGRGDCVDIYAPYRLRLRRRLPFGLLPPPVEGPHASPHDHGRPRAAIEILDAGNEAQRGDGALGHEPDAKGQHDVHVQLADHRARLDRQPRYVAVYQPPVKPPQRQPDDGHRESDGLPGRRGCDLAACEYALDDERGDEDEAEGARDEGCQGNAVQVEPPGRPDTGVRRGRAASTLGQLYRTVSGRRDQRSQQQKPDSGQEQYLHRG